MNQRGYVNLNLGAMFAGLLIAGIVAGIALTMLARWLWPILKAFIHQVTA